ncbi:25S rRNA (cytosine-C(5))-methyltransferase rcm1 [Fulvia fulva]|uniref:25S rRNA (Cytosine-C(5))-methyltransferase rcm1 n=1 Tax=Passalora fulva TaxID=5499 RepID=A0A9Q8L9F4_PASFU|nr:25S rRNA (cytosine-C(5))-methyltransferase rcm1 [Fulvia fulva]KAK4633972.1 25S rRNA (cytosine-C(5))-methyltransferase rcm1 [Fulvia fulva]UJO13370.1 25S rRNA (cytosine-C(5))-methyltransferase rcm1 [Fulvia fulva]WPV11461.1 25S rRNA (cytosine-C(5))-methyltransferase rcm1 [Fulvia fulva]
MSLYHEAAQILDKAKKEGGALKSIVFGKTTWKSDAKALYALTIEGAKWSEVLSEAIERSGILKVEKSLSPTLALLLTHDLFLARKGIALPATHGLSTCVSRHKVRLSAELTKARLRRGCATLDALRHQINSQISTDQQSAANGTSPARHPRWLRVNALKTTLCEELSISFANYTREESLQDITSPAKPGRLLYVDDHIPNLLAIAGPDNPTTFKSYKTGKLIIQEKASCFPAYLLDPTPGEGDVIDACAAPGNKTTHAAALLTGSNSRVIACEKDPERSKTLAKMVKLAGGDKSIAIKAKQDFLRLKPNSKEFANVTSLLLDPSCSGSGIFGRDEASLTVRLPSISTEEPTSKSRKRKRASKPPATLKEPEPEPPSEDVIEEETPTDPAVDDEEKLKARLENLSTFQLRILLHAMSFPAAKRITYSTCSIHATENEAVVVKALASSVAAERGWTVLRRPDQVDGMKRWHKRGHVNAVQEAMAQVKVSGTSKDHINAPEVADACIQCDKGGEDGTMGFFVAAFVRDDALVRAPDQDDSMQDHDDEVIEETEWNGFSGDEA